nr:MAG TPA: hypothetical protein [Caudoviricetes sp.]
MAKIYVELIRKGLKSIDDVPEKIKDQVKQVLAQLMEEENK